MELKNKSLEEKVEALKTYLSNENSDNMIIALNIFNLLKSGNNWSNSFFEHEDIIFNNIIEFIDIKNKLKNELDTFCLKVLNIYYSCIYNFYNLVEYQTDSMDIPNIYMHFLLQADFQTLAELSQMYNFKTFDGINYKNGFVIISSMANKVKLFNELILDINLNQKTE